MQVFAGMAAPDEQPESPVQVWPLSKERVPPVLTTPSPQLKLAKSSNRIVLHKISMKADAWGRHHTRHAPCVDQCAAHALHSTFMPCHPIYLPPRCTTHMHIATQRATRASRRRRKLRSVTIHCLDSEHQLPAVPRIQCTPGGRGGAGSASCKGLPQWR